MTTQELAQKILDLIKEADKAAEDDQSKNYNPSAYSRALDKIEALCKEQIKDSHDAQP